MLNSCKVDIFKKINAARLISLPVSVSHHFIKLSAACQQPDTLTVAADLWRRRKITSDLSLAESICAAASAKRLPNERFDGFNWRIAIQFLILLLLKACFFAGVWPGSLRASLFVCAPLFTNHLPIFYANGCLWLLTGGRVQPVFCMLDVWGLAEMTDEWIYGKLLATDLHESEWLTDKNALFHPIFLLLPWQ